MLGDHFCWPFSFPVSGSDLFTFNRSRQRPQGQTPGFWEVAPGRWPRMWVQRSVTQSQQQWHTIDTPILSLESLRPVHKLAELTYPFLSAPAHHMQQHLFSSSKKAWLLQGINLCLPTPLIFSLRTQGHLPKAFWILFSSLFYSQVRLKSGKMACSR